MGEPLNTQILDWLACGSDAEPSNPVGGILSPYEYHTMGQESKVQFY